MLVLTTGGAASGYTEDGLQGDIARILFPLQHGILHYTGFRLLAPFVAFGASYADPLGKASILATFEARLKQLSQEITLPPPDLEEFGEDLKRL